MDRLISLQAAIDAARDWYEGLICGSFKGLEKQLRALPSTQPEITPDGTLNVSIDADIASVGRILLSQTGTQRGGLYYKDAQPEIIRCKDCKYCDRGIDEDGNPFLKCLGWVYGGTQEEDFCSHAERRTDGNQLLCGQEQTDNRRTDTYRQIVIGLEI